MSTEALVFIIWGIVPIVCIIGILMLHPKIVELEKENRRSIDEINKNLDALKRRLG